MSWLKVDDGFDTHPKLLELTEVQRWRWTRVLIHCARHRTEGKVKTSVLRELGLSRAIGRLIEVGLLHPDEENGYVVHDWLVYNADTIGGKVAAFLAEHPDAPANEVCRAVGGKREIVLAEVAAQRESQAVPNRFPGTAKEPPAAGSPEPPGPVPDRYQIGSRARAPVPSRPIDQNPPTSNGVELPTTTEAEDFETGGIDPDQDLTALMGRATPEDIPF